MKILGPVIAAVGFFLIIGAAGAQDFWEQCHRAADCVAGDPPSTLHTFVQLIGGLLLMLIGVGKMILATERN